MKENSADITNEDLDLYKQWQADLELLESFPGEPAFDIMAQELREAGPPDRPELYHSPLIIDTDIGGDPDDAIAIAIAARSTPELALVVTSDECGGERARFARHYLDLLGRPEVPVVAGRQLADTRYHVVDGLIPADVPPQPADVLAAVDHVTDSTDGPIRWCGIGPLSNLADVLAARPQLRERLRVTQMGGAIN
ncbi:MAG TPA: nucleoside hydrolase, partial [Mycobacteriales bacterium]|nr:nucleoside hydrolase [Mycobacteriales bacterium]